MNVFYRWVFIACLIVPSCSEIVRIRFKHPMDLTELDALMLIVIGIGFLGLVAVDDLTKRTKDKP
jgi:hypothetical protein